MKLSIDWLGDWIDGVAADELPVRLTMIGLTVDGVERIGGEIEDVVVARVDTVERHPNADRLTLCSVFDGSTTRRVVCGAPNVRAGERYPFAPVGCALPGGLVIREATIRGERSQGMLCSEKELGLSEDASGLMTLPDAAQPGQKLVDFLRLRDTVLEIDVPHNRPDWLSALGIAREVSVITGRPPRELPSEPHESGPPASRDVRVVIEDRADCPLYGARIVRGVRIGPSPQWLQRRLEAIGQRSINNVVDVTNYVLQAFGQPIHSFDLDRLKGGEIRVRRARAGERLTTLDGVDRELSPDALVIADTTRPVALAGIMGGLDSEVTPGTANLLLESALFAAPVVRRGARTLGMDSEAALRFGRGVDAEFVLVALDHTARWIAEVSGGEVAPGRVVDGGPTPAPPAVVLRPQRLTHVLGRPVPPQDVMRILQGLGFRPQVEGNRDGVSTGAITCHVPSWRKDVTREIDLIEEVARHHGYERFDERRFNGSGVPARPNPVVALTERSARILVGFGFQEILSSVFERPSVATATRSWGFGTGDVVELLNAKGQDTSALRTALWPHQLRAARRNINQGAQSLRFFEHGKVYGLVDNRPAERWELAAVVRSPFVEGGWSGPEIGFDLFALKGIVEAYVAGMRMGPCRFRPGAGFPLLRGESFEIEEDDGVRARGGRIDPGLAREWDLPADLWLLSIDFERWLGRRAPSPRYEEPPRFPAVKRDLAFVVDKGTTHDALAEAIREAGGGLVRSVRLFDHYERPPVPAGKKSLAFAIGFQSPERSLTNAEVDHLVEAINVLAGDRFQATLRDF